MALWSAFALAVVLTPGLSLSGHSAADVALVHELADWVHLSAAVLWAGGLVSSPRRVAGGAGAAP